MSSKRFGKLFEHIDIGSGCFFDPLVQCLLSRNFIWLMPNIA